MKPSDALAVLLAILLVPVMAALMKVHHLVTSPPGRNVLSGLLTGTIAVLTFVGVNAGVEYATGADLVELAETTTISLPWWVDAIGAVLFVGLVLWTVAYGPRMIRA